MSSSKPSSPLAGPRPGTRHASPEELVLYALQFLSGEQAADLTHHFEHCAECLRELALVEGDLAIERVRQCVTEEGGTVIEVIDSPIHGMEGNWEYLLHARFGGATAE